jgi:hypothetical protein
MGSGCGLGRQRPPDRCKRRMNSHIVDCLEPQPELLRQTPASTCMPRRVGAKPRYLYGRATYAHHAGAGAPRRVKRMPEHAGKCGTARRAPLLAVGDCGRKGNRLLPSYARDPQLSHDPFCSDMISRIRLAKRSCKHPCSSVPGLPRASGHVQLAVAVRGGRGSHAGRAPRWCASMSQRPDGGGVRARQAARRARQQDTPRRAR